MKKNQKTLIDSPLQLNNITEYKEGFSTFLKDNLKVLLIDEEGKIFYIRKEEVGGGGDVEEAPLNGSLYGRQSAGWTLIPLSNYTLKTYVDGQDNTIIGLVNGKQATLISGSTIKTFGGVTLLGSGDIPISNQKLITGNVTLDDSYNGTIVKVKGNATISIPPSLILNFNCVFDVWSGFTATFTPIGGASIIETALILSQDKMATLYKDGNTTVYKLKGQTT